MGYLGKRGRERGSGQVPCGRGVKVGGWEKGLSHKIMPEDTGDRGPLFNWAIGADFLNPDRSFSGEMGASTPG